MFRSYTIGRLAGAVGVNVETVRYYQLRGLMAKPDRVVGGVRRYLESDAERLRFIQRAKRVGFTLNEVATLLDIRRHTSCRATRALAAERLRVVEERLQKLVILRKELKHWVAACDANSEDRFCPALNALEEAAT
jgi:MerR family mercuric resistance operon transcriptional regulator